MVHRDRNAEENPSDANRYAAAILRGLDDRIDRLENALSEDALPNIIRSVRDPLQVQDAVAVVDVSTSDPPFTWDDGSAAASTWDDTGESWA